MQYSKVRYGEVSAIRCYTLEQCETIPKDYGVTWYVKYDAIPGGKFGKMRHRNIGAVSTVR